MRVNDPSSFVCASDTSAMRVNGARRDPTVPRPPLCASYHPALPYALILSYKYVPYPPLLLFCPHLPHPLFHVEHIYLAT